MPGKVVTHAQVKQRLEGKERPPQFKSHEAWVNKVFKDASQASQTRRRKKKGGGGGMKSGAAAALSLSSLSPYLGHLETTLKSFPSPQPHFQSLIRSEHAMEEWYEALLLAHICNPQAKYPLPGILNPRPANTTDLFSQHFAPTIAELQDQRNFRVGRYECFDGRITVNHTMLARTTEAWIWIDPLDVDAPLRISEFEPGLVSLSAADIVGTTPALFQSGTIVTSYPWVSNPHAIRSSNGEFAPASPQPPGMTTLTVDPFNMAYVGGVSLDVEVVTQTAFTQTAMLARSDTLQTDRFIPGFISDLERRNGDYGETQNFRQALNGAARFSGTKWGQTRRNSDVPNTVAEFSQFSLNNAVVAGYPLVRLSQTLTGSTPTQGVTVSIRVTGWTGVSPLIPQDAGALPNTTVPFIMPEWFQYANATGAVTQESALAHFGAVIRSANHVGINHTGKTEIGRVFKKAVSDAGPKEVVKSVIGKSSHPGTKPFISALKTAGKSAGIWALKKAGEFAMDLIPGLLV